jgi:Tfp pilus assembly protein PilX
MRVRTSEQGSALILALVITIVVAGMSGTYLSMSVTKKNSAFQEVEREKAFYAAEAALAQAKYELTSGRDYDTTGLGNVTLNGLSNTQCAVTVDTTGLSGNQRRLTATCTYGPANKRTDRSIEEVVDKPVINTTALGMAAIVSRDKVDFAGNITVDGRDWDINGSAIVGPGVDGVVSGGSVTVGGSSGIGGNGLPPPAGGAAPGTTEANYDWAADGQDNDRDGTVDQPGETFPSDPDVALGLPAGTLKMAAQATNTYFSSQAAYTAAIAANGGAMPGGKIVYCDFSPSPPFELGVTMNNAPSILIIHNATSNAIAKNVHGQFKGLMMADKIEHINAGTRILGMVQAWGQAGNLFGNGNSEVLFSNAVLANLPAVTTSPVYIRRSFREVVR